jgi:hypothetical protein
VSGLMFQYGKVSDGDGPAHVSNIYQKRGNERRFGDSTMVFDIVLFIGSNVVCEPHVVQIV